jgi:hypothetical protein
MEPYQEAAEATRRSGTVPLNAIKYGAGLAIGTGGSMIAKNAISKIAPLLNSFVPWSFAKKALNKIDPRIGSFIKNSEDDGAESSEIKDFLSEKIKKSEPPKDNRNIIEQYSPELHQFIDQQIRGGRKPIEAAAIAQNDKRFSDIIKKLSKDHKTPWSSIIDSVYGMGERAAASNPKQEALNKWNERQKKQSFLEEERQRFEQGYGNQMEQQQGQQPQGGQPGPGQQALMAILNKINQKLGQ